MRAHLYSGSPGSGNRLTIDKASATDHLWVSAISVWELAVLQRRKRIHFNMDLNDWVEYSKNIAKINVCPLNEKIVIDSVNLKNFNNHDPADRFIISTSKYLNGKLITRDRDIIDYAKSNKVDIIKY